MFRTVRRWFSDVETRALSDDVQKWQDQVLSLAHKGEGLQLRIERLLNRVNMRMNRAGLPREQERDVEILEEIRASTQRPRDDWGDDPFQRPM
jgi:hypothetical protein